MTPIADMVTRMIAAGVAPDMIALAVSTAELCAAVTSTQAPPTHIDQAAERRRAWDRERKRLTRGMLLPVNEWIELVGIILDRDGHVCQYCGNGKKLTADHVTPLSRGGSNESINLVACCIPCNTKKSNRLLCEWLPDPRKSAGQNFVSNVARTIIIRETSTEVGGHPPTSNPPLTYFLPSTEIIESKKEEKKVRARSAPKVPLPADWQPTAAHFDAAEKLHIPRAAVISKAEDMRLWAQSSGAVKVSWDATFHVFLRRDAEKLKGNGNGKRTVQEASADLLERVRAFDEPAPSDIRGGTGKTDVRLLPQR